MSRALDTTADFAMVVDHLQAVTVLRPGSSLSLAVNVALRTPFSKTASRSKLGKYEQHDAIWHLPTTLPDFTPDLGDQILDADGNRWTVLSFRRTLDNSRWQLVARDMVAAHRLNDFVHIDRARFEKDDRAIETPVWRPWRTGLPARLELETVEFRRDEEPIGTTRQMVIHLEEPLPLDHSHRVRHDDGRTFEILRCRQKQELGTTFQIEVQEILSYE